jgi:hypothetical protein
MCRKEFFPGLKVFTFLGGEIDNSSFEFCEVFWGVFFGGDLHWVDYLVTFFSGQTVTILRLKGTNNYEYFARSFNFAREYGHFGIFQIPRNVP